nr:L,D-transpeptidase [Tessaracoccus sp. MC1679]
MTVVEDEASLDGQDQDHVLAEPNSAEATGEEPVVDAGVEHSFLVTSDPAGFPLGAKYIFSGQSEPGSSVYVWWDAEPWAGYSPLTTITAGSEGAYRLEVPIEEVGQFRFAATSGHVPGSAAPAGSWESAPVSVTATGIAPGAGTLAAGSSPGGFQVGSTYVFAGQALPGAPVVVWWDALPWKGWRKFGSTTAAADGSYRLELAIGSAAQFRFAATSGHAPGELAALGAWEAEAVYVNAVPAGVYSTRMSVLSSSSSGFVIGANYVFSGRTTPGMKVVVWWDAYPWKGWRQFSSTAAGSDGSWKLVLPVGSAAQFRFVATNGHLPGVTVAGGWQTVTVPVQAIVTPAMILDARCRTGRVICISKSQYELGWVVNGQIQFTMDVRFGSSKLPTRNGDFRVTRKSRNHVSSIYGSAMPFSLFFDGGRAVHYSRSFAQYGYAGNSAGCVNTRDYEMSEKLFDLARVGDRVIVF